MSKFFRAALLGFGLLSFTTPASAALVLTAGTGPATLPTNNFGFSGSYYVNNVFGAHPGGGPVAFLFVFNANGTISTYFDNTVGPYDAVEDTQVGVLNNTSGRVNSITLTAASATDLFGFDGDGINTFGAPGNASDTSGYGGPQTFFTGISPNFATGTANFIGGIAPGASVYFSLEEDPSTIGNIIVTPSVPEPSTLIMASISVIAGLGYRGWRRRSAGRLSA